MQITEIGTKKEEFWFRSFPFIVLDIDVVKFGLEADFNVKSEKDK